MQDEDQGEFFWSAEEQGLILGAFYYGYICTQIPGGMIAEKYGGKWLFGLGILGTAVLSLVTPVGARVDTAVLITIRVVQGLLEGFTVPALQAMMAKWLPPGERSRLAAVINSGNHVKPSEINHIL